MNALSLTSSVGGLITASRKVSALITAFKDAPLQAERLLSHVTAVNDSLRTLHTLLHSLPLRSPTPEFLNIEQLIVVLTRLVLTFADLEQGIKGFQVDGYPRLWNDYRWIRTEIPFIGIVQRLQTGRSALEITLRVLHRYADSSRGSSRTFWRCRVGLVDGAAS